ncbi:MAG: orotidine-5'-phosphate decarboxylase [Bacteroidales bacterium]|nr:orotidine-5'-phosphate decarboxylase [Bacteroidales bacterium]
MTREELYQQMRLKKTTLCVGLDTDYDKIPECIKSQYGDDKAAAVLAFNKAIVDATAPYCIAYKPNLAFYECYGSAGIKCLEETAAYIRSKYPEIFLIADAKRGDIGNTAKMYAKTFFEEMDFDAVTLSPYMGTETATPFLAYPGKYVIVVALSSNPTSVDFQLCQEDGKPLYQVVMEKMMAISTPENMMFVVGATKADKLSEIRKFCPDNFFLVPGVGAQGGSAEEVIANGSNDLCGLIINSSRGVLYASKGEDFAEAAAKAAAATARL